MFHPLSVFVGLRYVRARTHKFFVSFITWASLAGVCVGVAALIVILSVMNGFEDELLDRLLSLSAHARVVASSSTAADERANAGPQSGPSAGATPNAHPSGADWREAEKRVRAVPGVTNAASYAEIQAL